MIGQKYFSYKNLSLGKLNTKTQSYYILTLVAFLLLFGYHDNCSGEKLFSQKIKVAFNPNIIRL